MNNLMKELKLEERKKIGSKFLESHVINANISTKHSESKVKIFATALLDTNRIFHV